MCLKHSTLASIQYGEMTYRCEATSVIGFLQQVATQYLRHGYWFYVAARIPNGKDRNGVDHKLVTKYGIDRSQKQRCSRKRRGEANVQYIRYDDFFLLLATHGRHSFFEDEAGQIRDARHTPIKFAGYSVSHRNGRVCVRIAQGEYRQLKTIFIHFACRRSCEGLATMFANIPFVPYAPVRQQIMCIWRKVNRARSTAGYERLPIECVPWRRRIVRPFEENTASRRLSQNRGWPSHPSKAVSSD